MRAQEALPVDVSCEMFHVEVKAWRTFAKQNGYFKGFVDSFFLSVYRETINSKKNNMIIW